MKNIPIVEFVSPTQDNQRLANLCGPLDQNLRQIEQGLNVQLRRRGHLINIQGKHAQKARDILENLYLHAENSISPDEIQLAIIEINQLRPTQLQKMRTEENIASKLFTQHHNLRGRTPTQCEYIHNILTHDITFGLGPAGTGKTYLAVACAVDALERDLIKRIILIRPAVEAGERLGFLPGDLNQKVDPYLRPLYDALYELMGFEKTFKLFERQVIEIAPLAYMRGRTLNQAFIILDEAQNTTPEQMKMFLTRMGFGSKAVITGDVSQIDLPKKQKSGLVEAQQVLAHLNDIAMTHFSSADVVRHPLVAKIVDAYEKFQYKTN